jgi:hypothetical protein
MLAPAEPLRKVRRNGWGFGENASAASRQSEPLGVASNWKSRTGWALGMGNTDDRKLLTPAELIEQVERSNPTVIEQVLANDAQITLRERLLLRAWLRPRSETEPLQ